MLRKSHLRAASWSALALTLLIVPASAAKKPRATTQQVPELLLEGGRKLSFERTYSSEREIRGKQGFWSKLADVVVGEREYKSMTRPYSIAVDSRGRVIVSDPGMGGIHIFDAQQHKYKFIERLEKSKDPMLEPQCLAVDSKDNIYVTDSRAGKVFVFDPNGKSIGVFGSLKGGEGFFKRPTGISIDTETQEVYVTDTLRDKVFVLDAKGVVQRSIGQHGFGPGEFNYPTEVLARNGTVAVVDAMNFRVQIFNRAGALVGTIGTPGEVRPEFFRPKGIALDSENHIYLVEGFSGAVQVFDHEGQLLYTFGKRGTGLWQFQLPAGVFIDRNDRVYVVDSFNQRVQVFQYHGIKPRTAGGLQ